MGDGTRQHVRLLCPQCLWYVDFNISLAPLSIQRQDSQLGLAVFYGGYGVILCPSLGVLESYGGPTPEYFNAMGFYVLSKSSLTLDVFND
jgi:hypothetical protein